MRVPLSLPIERSRGCPDVEADELKRRRIVRESFNPLRQQIGAIRLAAQPTDFELFSVNGDERFRFDGAQHAGAGHTIVNADGRSVWREAKRPAQKSVVEHQFMIVLPPLNDGSGGRPIEQPVIGGRDGNERRCRRQTGAANAECH